MLTNFRTGLIGHLDRSHCRTVTQWRDLRLNYQDNNVKKDLSVPSLFHNDYSRDDNNVIQADKKYLYQQNIP